MCSSYSVLKSGSSLGVSRDGAMSRRFAKVAIQRLMEILQKGDEQYHGTVLDILKALFEVSRHKLGFRLDLSSMVAQRRVRGMACCLKMISSPFSGPCLANKEGFSSSASTGQHKS